MQPSFEIQNSRRRKLIAKKENIIQKRLYNFIEVIRLIIIDGYLYIYSRDLGKLYVHNYTGNILGTCQIILNYKSQL